LRASLELNVHTREARLARAFVVGNGSILATGDRHGTLREIYAPSLAPEHQLLRRPARIGLLADGAVHWLPDGFEGRFADQGDAPIVDLALLSGRLGLEAWVETYVDVELNAVVRRIQITNRTEEFRDLRLCLHHDLALGPGEPRETLRRDPATGALYLHSGRRHAVINLEALEGTGVPLWTGLARAQDDAPGSEELIRAGRIDAPSQAHGRVDSIVAAPIPLGPGGSAMVTAWVAFGSTAEEARAADESLRRLGIAGSLARTRAHWNLWASQGSRDFMDLPEDVATLYHRSLVILRLHQTPSGAILSAAEPRPEAAAYPEYRWCWNRDAAVAADTLGRAGYHGHARRYFEFLARATAEAGVLPEILDAEGSPVGAPAGIESVALPLWAIGRHFDRERDVEYLSPLYRNLVLPAADRLAASIDPSLGLPLSVDPWGGHVGAHVATAAALRGGLRAAARLAACFGEATRARAWSAVSDHVARSMTRHLYRSEWSRYARSVAREGRGLMPDPTMDATLLWLGLWEDSEVEDARVRSTVDAVRESLWVRTGVGGLARQERDPLATVGTDLAEVPGTPHVAPTLWLAAHAIRGARRAQDLDPARTLLLWCAARAEGAGVLPELLHPYRGETKGASPSLMAHAWLAATVIDYVDRLRLLRRCDRCGAPAPARREKRAPAMGETIGEPPRLLPGLVADL
jgi:GH15 family glucan-1,4-alpha-glucosidase